MTQLDHAATRATAETGQSLFELIRYWSRRSALGRPGAGRARHTLVLEAVDALAGRGMTPSIGSVADELGLDQSGASRLVAAAEDAGCLGARTSAADARRRELALTPAGQELLSHAHAWQEDVFHELTDGWTDARRARLGRDLRELIVRSANRMTPEERA